MFLKTGYIRESSHKEVYKFWMSALVRLLSRATTRATLDNRCLQRSRMSINRKSRPKYTYWQMCLQRKSEREIISRTKGDK